jgi:hypothetical protein
MRGSSIVQGLPGPAGAGVRLGVHGRRRRPADGEEGGERP